MTRIPRIALLAVALALAPALAGCENFDPDNLDVFGLNKKKPLPGERRELFPGGVPGVTQGIPPEYLKSNVEAQQKAEAEAAAEQKKQEEEKAAAEQKKQDDEKAAAEANKKAAEAAKPKPKPKRKVVRAPAPTQVTVQPTRAQSGPLAPWPDANQRQPQSGQSPWPSPPQSQPQQAGQQPDPVWSQASPPPAGTFSR
jgi:hypothetical protein